MQLLGILACYLSACSCASFLYISLFLEFCMFENFIFSLETCDAQCRKCLLAGGVRLFKIFVAIEEKLLDGLGVALFKLPPEEHFVKEDFGCS